MARAMNNLRNSCLGHAEAKRQFLALGCWSQSDYLKHLFFAKFEAFVSSAFPYAIVEVLLVGAKKQVCRIDALRIVTRGAVVKYLQAIWNRPVVNQPTNSMSVRLAVMAAFNDLSVTGAVARPLPQPAPVRVGALFNFAPKPFEDGRREALRDEECECSVRLFGNHSLLSRALGCFSSAGVFSFCGSSTLTPMSA